MNPSHSRKAVPGSGRTLTSMRPQTLTVILTASSRPVKGARLLLNGDWPWTIRRVRDLPDGRYEVLLTR
ncbi:hypothetical protein [uncultured Deinococcus sp.]|uniref:hypothetical protein n=1 Tax=uncultured Deinococcus sp. TaxID=158789 RepID=UPI0025F4F995|nr:hypothetical protein [uncultured Deinococcus sp.]